MNLLPVPFFAFEIAELTNAKTRIGAIALSAATNKFPKSPINFALGTVIPSIIPIINPIIIFNIKLESVHFFYYIILTNY